MHKFLQTIGAKVLRNDCCLSAVIRLHFVEGMKGRPQCNCMDHGAAGIALDYWPLTLSAGAKRVNVSLQVSPGCWLTCKELLVSSPAGYPIQPMLFVVNRQILYKGLKAGAVCTQKQTKKHPTKNCTRSKSVACPMVCQTFQRVQELGDIARVC